MEQNKQTIQHTTIAFPYFDKPIPQLCKMALAPSCDRSRHNAWIAHDMWNMDCLLLNKGDPDHVFSVQTTVPMID